MTSNAQRRAVLMIQHDRLRTRIADLRTAAASVMSYWTKPPDTALEELISCIEKFGNELLSHLATEEDILIPLLERAQPWGGVRIQVLLAEHAHQRGVLEILRTAALPAQELAKRAWNLSSDVLADMQAEECDLLSESVFGEATAAAVARGG